MTKKKIIIVFIIHFPLFVFFCFSNGLTDTCDCEGAELAYQRVPGVISTKVGYTQGKTEKPTYKQVCSGSTGHAEAVAVDFDPSVVSYKDLVDLFWERLGKSALTLNQVGNDVRIVPPPPPPPPLFTSLPIMNTLI